MNCLSEGYKWSVQKIWGCIAKTDFWAEIRDFGPQKNTLLNFNHVLATTGKSRANKRVPFSQITISL